jgi:hypothetical protein
LDASGATLDNLHTVRQIGTAGPQRLDVHSDAEAAVNALAGIVQAKSRRGYRPRRAS